MPTVSGAGEGPGVGPPWGRTSLGNRTGLWDLVTGAPVQPHACAGQHTQPAYCLTHLGCRAQGAITGLQVGAGGPHHLPPSHAQQEQVPYSPHYFSHLKNTADVGGNGIPLFEFAFPDDLRLGDTVLCIYSTIALPFL